MVRQYTHTPLDEQVFSISGYYILEKEERLAYDDREVFYVVGSWVVDSSCCGSGGTRYALVPGYVKHWQLKMNDSGQALSEVEPIADEAVKDQIRARLAEKETVTQVQFW